MEIPKLDEHALRRPSFQEGREIALADGQTWTIPVAETIFIFDESATDGFRTEVRIAGATDAEFPKLMTANENAESNTDFLRTTFAVMAYLLRVNYDLTSAMIGSLIPLSFKQGETDPIYEEFMAAARGDDAPKPSAGGSDLL